MCYLTDLHSPVLSPPQKWVCHISPCRMLVSVTTGIRPLTAWGVNHVLGPSQWGTVGPLRESK